MPTARPVPCEFCGDPLTLSLPVHRRPLCSACERLAQPLLVFENPRDGAREVMISQHPGEARRKLLELHAHSVVVFLGAGFEIVALEIEAAAGNRVLYWHHESGSREYFVRNTGRSYANRDEMVPRAGFDRDALSRDIAASRENLRPAVRAALAAALAG